MPRNLLERYRAARSAPVSIDQDRCYQYAPRLMVRPLAAAGTLVRHDPDRLAEAIMAIGQQKTANEERSTGENGTTPPEQLRGSWARSATGEPG
jgi:hypothetical protein